MNRRTLLCMHERGSPETCVGTSPVATNTGTWLRGLRRYDGMPASQGASAVPSLKYVNQIRRHHNFSPHPSPRCSLCGRPRHVVLHDGGDVGEVQPAGGHVRAQQHAVALLWGCGSG